MRTSRPWANAVMRMMVIPGSLMLSGSVIAQSTSPITESSPAQTPPPPIPQEVTAPAKPAADTPAAPTTASGGPVASERPDAGATSSPAPAASNSTSQDATNAPAVEPATTPPLPAPPPLPTQSAVVPAEPKLAPQTTATSEEHAGKLRLTARPGAYLTAQQRVIHVPFTSQTSTQIVMIPWPPTGGPLQGLAGGNPGWDLAEVDTDEAATACAAGHLEKIDQALIPKAADGTPVDRDYIAGGLTPCSVATVSWSSIIAFDRRAWPAQTQPQAQAARGSKRAKPATTPGKTPATLKDLFDVTGFPGMRALRKVPADLLELSLMADGVAAESVYRTLATEEGTARAFARLENLRGKILWADTPAQAGQLLIERKAVMAMIYNGRAFQYAAVEGKPIGVIWDGQIYRLDSWVIAKGAREAAKARDFISFASEPARLAAVSEQFPYGPARASAVAKVGRHPVLKTEMSAYLPTASANLTSALQFDAQFWSKNGTRLNERFEAWLKGPLPAPAAAPSVPATSTSGQPG